MRGVWGWRKQRGPGQGRVIENKVPNGVRNDP